MNELILSLGTNIEPKKEYLSEALSELEKYFKPVKVSSLYLSEPLYDAAQDYFLNICVLYETDIDNPLKILHITGGIEKKIGRVKNVNRPKGPRIIDIDIIFFNDDIVRRKNLIIPHAGTFERKFVLKPLIEILPKSSINYKKYELKKRLSEIKNQKIRKIGVLVN